MVERLKGEKERKLLFRTKQKLEKEETEEKKRTSKRKGKVIKTLRGAFQPRKGVKAERRALGRRQRGVKALFGYQAVTGERVGRGRPTGTFKYGVPIHEYKKLMSRKRALYEQYKEQKILNLQRKGLSKEQINKLRVIKEIESGGRPLGVLETPESVMKVVDEDLEFTKFRADKTIHPNTQKILRRLRHIQLKSERDDVEMQRRNKEKRMVASAGNILETPFVFNKHQLDTTGIGQDNILLAPSVFRENPEDNILRSNKLNIMQTREAGNNLKFF